MSCRQVSLATLHPQDVSTFESLLDTVHALKMGFLIKFFREISVLELTQIPSTSHDKLPRGQEVQCFPSFWQFSHFSSPLGLLGHQALELDPSQSTARLARVGSRRWGCDDGKIGKRKPSVSWEHRRTPGRVKEYE